MTPGGTRSGEGGGRGIVGPLAVHDLLLLATVAALPWIWGGVLPDTQRAAAAAIGLAAGWALVRDGASGLGLSRSALWLLPAFALLVFAFAQTVPLPRAFVALVSPKAASLQEDAFGPVAGDAAGWLRYIEGQGRALVPEAPSAAIPKEGALDPGPEAPAPPRRFTLSLQPGSTEDCASLYAALLLAFLLVHRRTASERRARVYRWTLFASFCALAIVGLLNHLTAPARLLWLRDAPAHSNPFGPYVNPSHFVGAMELAVPWLLGYGLWAVSDRGESPRRFDAGMLALGGALVGGAAALLAASKMAAFTIGVASIVLVALAIAAAKGRRRSVLIACVAAAALLFGVIVLSGPLRKRVVDFEATHSGGVSTNLRGLAWGAGLRMARDFPVTGSGFGAFAELIPAYLPRGESQLWSALHNDYLEAYLAGGAIAVVFIAWLAVAYGWRVVRALRLAARRGRLMPVLGATLGLVALAAHEAVDFNLQIPANALLFVVIAAMVVAPLQREGESA